MREHSAAAIGVAGWLAVGVLLLTLPGASSASRAAGLACLALGLAGSAGVAIRRLLRRRAARARC